jgi:hypothetical protein
LADGDGGIESVGDLDDGERGDGHLEELAVAGEADVLEVVDAFLGEAGDLEGVAGCRRDLDRRGDSRADELPHRDHSIDDRRRVILEAAETGLDERGRAELHGGGGGEDLEAGALDPERCRGDDVRSGRGREEEPERSNQEGGGTSSETVGQPWILVRRFRGGLRSQGWMRVEASRGPWRPGRCADVAIRSFERRGESRAPQRGRSRCQRE